MVMRYRLRPLSAVWKERRQGHETHPGTRDEDDDLLTSHMMFADNCYILASSRSNVRRRTSYSATLERRAKERQHACCSSALDEMDLEFTMNDVEYKIPRVQEMLVVGSLLSNEADTMSAMRHHLNRAMSSMRAEMYVYKNPTIPERRKHGRCKQVEQAAKDRRLEMEE